ncbi:MAG TPA: hydantoinase/oxoprolinase family protein [Candidatus Atribacteria bacterium]|nr:hydantoinase/oxoprolinase family protein [Candidatus Atribacteria bacterium]
MRLGLGIDTGGTYTDSVIYDFEAQEVVAGAKALTTRDNLSTGIIRSLRQLPNDIIKEVGLVSLSTTLATNTCVEGKGGRGRLVLIGYDADLYQRLKGRYGLPDMKEVIMIDGGHNQQGQVAAEPDWTALEERIRETLDHTDAYGIVEYWGIRNSAFEQQARDLIRGWTGRPVVCAHELSTEINTLRRAATTLLNANLINLIDALLDAVKEGLCELGVAAPIMVVKGDGTLMSEAFAREHPVETLLSGPAASVVGGMKLTDCQSALILDIGGTTSDLAQVKGGMTVLAEQGVDVGSWKTGTSAIRIKTIGLGGDSIISFDKNDCLTIGPRKAVPLSYLALKYPAVKEELRKIEHENRWHTLPLGEFFCLAARPEKTYELTEAEKAIVAALEKGPLSRQQLSEALDVSMFLLYTESLERSGFVIRGGLTPSDIMHVTNDYLAWDREAALSGTRIMARRLNMTVDQLIDRVNSEIVRMLYNLIVEFLLSTNAGLKGLQAPDARALLDMSFSKPCEDVRIDITTRLPIIGIGAPAHVYIDKVASRLGTVGMIPPHAGIANAVGAVTGSIAAEETVLIKPRYDRSGITGYGCHASSDYFETEDYDEALEWAKSTALMLAGEHAAAMGASNITREVRIDIDKYEDARVELLMEVRVVARAVGSRLIYSRA